MRYKRHPGKGARNIIAGQDFKDQVDPELRSIIRQLETLDGAEISRIDNSEFNQRRDSAISNFANYIIRMSAVGFEACINGGTKYYKTVSQICNNATGGDALTDCEVARITARYKRDASVETGQIPTLVALSAANYVFYSSIVGIGMDVEDFYCEVNECEIDPIVAEVAA